MIFTSFSVKYPLGCHQLFVLAGLCGMKKKEASPTKTATKSVSPTSGISCRLTGEKAPKHISDDQLIHRGPHLLDKEQPSPACIP